MADTPLLPEEGWTRHQEDIAKPPLRSGRGGRSHAIFPNASLNTACARRCFLMAAGIASCFALSRSRFARACAGSARRLRRFGGFAPFSYWRSHPLLWEDGPPLTDQLTDRRLRTVVLRTVAYGPSLSDRHAPAFHCRIPRTRPLPAN